MMVYAFGDILGYPVKFLTSIALAKPAACIASRPISLEIKNENTINQNDYTHTHTHKL